MILTLNEFEVVSVACPSKT